MIIKRYYRFESCETLFSILDCTFNNRIRLSSNIKSYDYFENLSFIMQSLERNIKNELLNANQDMNYVSFIMDENISIAMIQNFCGDDGIIVEYEVEDKYLESEDSLFVKVEYKENSLGVIKDAFLNYKFNTENSYEKYNFVINRLKYKDKGFSAENEIRFAPIFRDETGMMLYKNGKKIEKIYSNYYFEFKLPNECVLKKIYLTPKTYNRISECLNALRDKIMGEKQNNKAIQKPFIDKYYNISKVLKTYMKFYNEVDFKYVSINSKTFDISVNNLRDYFNLQDNIML